MKLIPKRKVAPKEMAGGDQLLNYISNFSEYLTETVQNINTTINMLGDIVRVVYIKVISESTSLTTGDGKAYVTIPQGLNGMNLLSANANVYTKSSSGNVTVSIEKSPNNGVQWTDMLVNNIVIEANEYASFTATTQPSVNLSQDIVVKGYWVRVNVDGAGTGTKGLDVMLTFRQA